MNRSNAPKSDMVSGDRQKLRRSKKTPAEPSEITTRQEHSQAVSSGQTTNSHQSHQGHGHTGHSHVHDEESIRRIVNRLSRIEGHVRGLKRMVQEQDNCPDVLIQVAAVRGALDKVARLILDEHLTQCVLRAAEQGNIEAEIEELQAALNRFLP